jgi:hypothetical protein
MVGTRVDTSWVCAHNRRGLEIWTIRSSVVPITALHVQGSEMLSVGDIRFLMYKPYSCTETYLTINPCLLWKLGFYILSPVLRIVTSTAWLYHTPKLTPRYIFTKSFFRFRYFISWPQNTLQASVCSTKFIIPAVTNAFATSNITTAAILPL